MSDKKEPQPSFRIRHKDFGYWTGTGWSPDATKATVLTEQGVNGWIEMFRDFTRLGGKVFDRRAYTVETVEQLSN